MRVLQIEDLGFLFYVSGATICRTVALMPISADDVYNL
jgi:hypothetical protein